MMEVAVGQVWKDNDKRSLGATPGEPRYIVIIDVNKAQGRVQYFASRRCGTAFLGDFARTTAIKRFKGGARGFTYYGEAISHGVKS